MRRLLAALLVALAGWGLATPATANGDARVPVPAGDGVRCAGALAQGGLLVCLAPPGTVLETGEGQVFRANGDGAAVLGLRRNAPAGLELLARLPDGRQAALSFEIAPREDEFRVVKGLDCDKVDARSEEQKAHAARSWQKKAEAWATFKAGRGALDGFRRPAEGRSSSPFGPARRYIGVSAVTGEPCDRTSVHRGYDIAAPIGTPILAPAAGTVILADPDLYYEGGTVFLDHGQGLVSIFLHMSAVDVEAGQLLAAGDLIGKVGNTGRTTGPHLHWAVKWRDLESEDRGRDFYIDPALLMEMELP